jgi:nitroimidazol reductase NimA-like FMN-containing flavoprotein (pyridoxamine 5'-phosphate oxidase superfamily)
MTGHKSEREGRPPDRIRVRRNPKKGRYERAAVEAILDRALVAHLAFVDHGEPVCIPMLFARLGGKLYIHGSRSAFEHSANYESVVVFGRFDQVEDADERLAPLAAFANQIVPGRFDEVRPPNAKELKATTILAMPIELASAKVRYGPPDDDDTEDAGLDVWAGEVPVVTSFGEPIPSPGLRAGIPIPASVHALMPAAAGAPQPAQAQRGG